MNKYFPDWIKFFFRIGLNYIITFALHDETIFIMLWIGLNVYFTGINIATNGPAYKGPHSQIYMSYKISIFLNDYIKL